MIMTGGEMCLLMTNRPLSFGDKVCRRRPTLPRCLFGPPDHAETERLLQEELQRERERFQRRWNIDLDMIEAAIEKGTKTAPGVTQGEVKPLEKQSRIPSAVEERLSSTGPENDKTCRISSECGPTIKKAAVCKKPCSKFQKRVRVTGAHKKQTHLTDFWRSRRSLAFVFGKSKARAVSLQSVLEPPVVD